MLNYRVEERTNANDIPKPKKVAKEWVIVTEKGYLVDAPAFPHTEQGKKDAQRVVRLLEGVHEQGIHKVQRAMRRVLGLSQ